MRLQSYLARAGVASRRGSADLVRAGKVSVNGVSVREPGFAVDAARDVVLYLGRAVVPEKKLTYAFHKPRGVVTTLHDPQGRKTVADFFRSVPARLFPVGRLDKDTTGLLIMTNDGELAVKLAHPRHGCEKVYEAVVAAPLSVSQMRRFERGLEVYGRKTAPCRVAAHGRRPHGFLYEITLHEGRKRQIREMLRAVGAVLRSLHRPRFGPLRLGGLEPGSFRELTSAELALLARAGGRRVESPRTKPLAPVLIGRGAGRVEGS